MNSEKESKVNMFHSVTDLCDNNAAIVALVLAFGTSYNIFKTTVTAIAQGMMDLSAQTGGHRVAKSTAKRTLASMGSGIAGMVYAYASVTNNDVLKNAMNITKSKINKALDDEVQGICMNIYNAANDNIANLADYGITPALLATYLSAINDYVAKAPKPKQARNYKKMVEEQVNTMIKDADKILNEQMDELVVNYLSNGNEEFEGQYRAARVIIEPGSFSTVLKIVVVNQANNEPIKGVKCYRDGTAPFKKSSTKGIITYKDIEEGGHSFVLKHKLFADLTITGVMISHGNKHSMNAQMIPEQSGGSNPPAGFSFKDLIIPAGGSLIVPVTDGTDPIPASFELYLLSINGNAKMCTTNLPASPCTSGYQLTQGVAFLGVAGDLGLDLTKNHIQFINPGDFDITVRVGVRA